MSTTSGRTTRFVYPLIVLMFGAFFGLLFGASAQATTVTPTLVPGNPTCQDLGYDYGFKPSTSGGSQDTAGTYDDPNSGVVVSWEYSRSGSTAYVDWTSNIGPVAVIVKGGDAANVYEYDGSVLSDTDLVTPDNASGRPAGLSHLEFCFNYQAVVTKTATTSYTRDFDWTVLKAANPTSLLLSAGQTMPVTYTITVGNTYTDSNFVVSGVVTVSNPWPMAASVVSVTDSLLPGETLTCSSNTIPANGSVTCAYSASVPSKASGTNTATATVNYGAGNRTSSGSAAYSFGAPTTVVDATATLDDVRGACPAGFTCVLSTGTVPNQLVLTAPGTVSYTINVTATQCGMTGQLLNTATLIEGTSGTSHNSSATVDLASAGCTTGCTLTQGYWKTHSVEGPAPYDDNWANLGPLQEDTVFFSSGKTWYQVFWTAPAGNAYYILAHQYMAAELNVLNGATTTPEVDAALAQAETLFASVDGTRLTKAQSDLAKSLAATLDNWNQGITGPGHCSE